MSTTIENLEEQFSQQIGDWLEVIVSTAIPAGVTISSTHLNSYDAGRDDYFIDWWVYITDKANAGVLRQVSDYATSGGVLTVRGANLTNDVANIATIRLHRYNRDKIIEAFNDTSREVFPNLYRRLDNITLITGNILPNSHFEDWALTTVPDKYSLSNTTVTENTTVSYLRGGAASAKVHATAAAGYMEINSDTYPRLLDLMGKTVNFRCWAYPEDLADDAAIEIYTLKADTTAQTLTSTTSNPISKWTLIELANQSINDDIQYISIRFKVVTNGNDVFYDKARLVGYNQSEYLLPTDFRDGSLLQVYTQASGYADYACDDIMPRTWSRVFGYNIIRDGTDAWLQLPFLHTSEYLIRLIGTTPLETVYVGTVAASVVLAYADTISLDGEKLNLFIAYAKYKFWQKIEPPVSSEDTGRYEGQSAKCYGEYQRLLSKHKMMQPSGSLKLPVF